MKKLITYTLLISTLSLTAQDLHTRNNGASQNSVIIVRSDNASGDQDQSQTSDLDFQVWDSNTRLDIPQGRIGMVGEGTSSQANEASGRMAFYTSNVAYPSPALIERMRITETGNIGMGTFSPISRLHLYENISGSTTLLTLEKYESDINNDSEINLDFIFSDGNNNGKPQARISTVANTDTSNGLGMEAEGTADIKFWTASANSNTSSLLSERMRITSLGNVGIGTTTPDMKLTVRGNIHAEEVKIDLSVPAPDYVFKDDYNLRSIEQVEKFVKANSHLPEIPSAKEFEQNGVMQAEMDMNLLKKIEELTLYTIQQEKKIKRLESLNLKMLKQEKEIKELKGIVEQLIRSQK